MNILTQEIKSLSTTLLRSYLSLFKSSKISRFKELADGEHAYSVTIIRQATAPEVKTADQPEAVDATKDVPQPAEGTKPVEEMKPIC